MDSSKTSPNSLLPDSGNKPLFPKNLKVHRWLRRASYILLFIVGLTIGILASHIFYRFQSDQQQSFIDSITSILNSNRETLIFWGNVFLLSLFGAFGGFLYSLQNNRIRLPFIIDHNIGLAQENSAQSSRGKELDLGVFADCLVGIGGAFVIYLIFPQQSNPQDASGLIHVAATSMLGGYGGRRILDQALANLAQQQKELKKQVEDAKVDIDTVKLQAEKDAETLKLLSRHLDKSLMLNPEEEKVLLGNITIASPITRTYIFRQTQAELFEIAQKIPKTPARTIDNPLVKLVVENARKVFKALQESDTNQDNDRYPAHVAYAEMALGAWDDAIKNLEKAQMILDHKQPDGNPDVIEQNRAVYRCNQLICRLNRDRPDDVLPTFEELKLVKSMLDKIESLADYKTLWQKIDKLLPGSDYLAVNRWLNTHQNEEPIKLWMQENNIQV